MMTTMLFLLLIGSTAAFNGGFVVPPAGGSIGESFETPVQVNGIFPGQPCFATVIPRPLAC